MKPKKPPKHKPQVQGKKLSYPAGQIVKYRAKLRGLVDKMTQETNRRIKSFLVSGLMEGFVDQQEEAAALDTGKFPGMEIPGVALDEPVTSKAKTLVKMLSDKFTQLFGDAAKPYATSMVDAQKKVSKTNVDQSLKDVSKDVTLKSKLAPKGMEDVTNAIIQENIALIKSIPDEYMNQIQGTLMRSLAAGGDTQTMTKALIKYDGMTKRRADNIADDQVRKTYNAVNKQRMQSAGVKKFKWLHSGGGQHPRPDHVAMSGNIYNFDDPPVIDERTGETGIPGQAINCRCTMTPVIELDVEE